MWRTWGRYAAALGAIAVVLWFPMVRGGRVPLLWAADLGFHELGHLVATPLGQTAHFLAGSATQVLVPLGLAVYFWIRQRHHIATGLMLAWAAAAAYDAAAYISDAPFQRLPLIGGHHDWAFLLGRWDALHQADTIARAVRLGGLIVGLDRNPDLCGSVVRRPPPAPPSPAKARRSRSASPCGRFAGAAAADLPRVARRRVGWPASRCRDAAPIQGRSTHD